MRIEIDTKEDLHNVRHIIRLLQAISGHSGRDSYRLNDDLFTESSSSSSTPNPVSNPDTSASLFNMFGDGSSGSSTTPSDSSLGIPSIFNEPKKDEDNKKDFLDSLQVY